MSNVTHILILEQEADVFTGNLQVAMKGMSAWAISDCALGFLGELNNRVFYFTTHSLSKISGHF